MQLLVLGDFFYGDNSINSDIRELSQFIERNELSLIVNLEGPITDRGERIRKRGEHLRQSKVVLQVLKMLHVVGVSLANNHIMDFGEEGLLDTIDHLDRERIRHTGAGYNLQESTAPMILKDNDTGIEYSFYGMSDNYEEAVCAESRKSGCAPIRVGIREKSAGIVAGQTNGQVGLHVALLHTGFEYNTLPMPRNIKQCKALVDDGFDYVICSHPHVVQPYWYYHEKLICSSIGNFYFSIFRDEFERKTLYNKPKGYCNEGLGVLVPTGHLLRVMYNEHNKATKFGKNLQKAIESDRFSGPYYYLSCFRNRNNHNPILTGYECVDRGMLYGLNIAYKAHSVLKWKRMEKI